MIYSINTDQTAFKQHFELGLHFVKTPDRRQSSKNCYSQLSQSLSQLLISSKISVLRKFTLGFQ